MSNYNYNQNYASYVPPPQFNTNSQQYPKPQYQQDYTQPPVKSWAPTATVVAQPYATSYPVANARPMKKSNNAVGIIVSVVVGVVVLIVIVVAISAFSGSSSDPDSGSGGDSPINTEDIPLFPDEFRIDDNYIGLLVVSELDQDSADAFVNAANRWSRIVGGTLGSFAASTPANFNWCGSGNILQNSIVVDHLIILAEVTPIDGVNNILGQAGFCNTIGGFPATGIMSFDSADVSQLINSGTLEAVILHEMGHVLGIGTLFEAKGLFADGVFQNDGSKVVTNQPKFLGTTAIAEFRTATGSATATFVPVENGITNGVNLFPGATDGAGSIDGHWDEDFMQGELMEFRININNGQPPLSAISIASLQDMGYTVSFDEADEFSTVGARPETAEVAAQWIWLYNDSYSVKGTIEELIEN